MAPRLRAAAPAPAAVGARGVAAIARVYFTTARQKSLNILAGTQWGEGALKALEREEQPPQLSPGPQAAPKALSESSLRCTERGNLTSRRQRALL